jgi:hypothetical protein
MSCIPVILDKNDLASAFKLSNEAINLKNTYPIIKGLSMEDKKLIFKIKIKLSK